MKEFLNVLTELSDYSDVEQALVKKRKCVFLSGCTDVTKVHLAESLRKNFSFNICVTYDEKRAMSIASDACFFSADTYIYPAKDIFFDKADKCNNEITLQRLKFIEKMTDMEYSPDNGNSVTVVVTPEVLKEKTVDPAALRKGVINISRGEEKSKDELIKELVATGYKNEDVVCARGTFAQRGGIVDIFPVSEQNPVRLEFFGDEIDSLRYFDPQTQRKIQSIEKIRIFPASEKTPEDVNNTTLTDFINLFPDDTLFWWDEFTRIKENYECTHEAVKLTKDRPNLFMSTLGMKDKDISPDLEEVIESGSVSSYNNSFEELISDLKRYKKLKYRTVFITSSESRAERLADDFREYGLESFALSQTQRPLTPGLVAVVHGALTRGYVIPEIKFAVISENDIFKTSVKKKSKKRRSVHDDLDLSSGDYVVHENYGIGVYKGIVKQTIQNSEKDYIQIEYAGNSRVFIPVAQTDMLQKYASADVDKKPKISKLGTITWENTKKKTKAAVELVADDLIQLYASRSQIKGFCFDEDNEWQKEFEESFPYEETTDQLNAIDDVKADMQSEKIMDRLICGDVGFGKTEVALRAAFKAIQSGKQVAFITPTTLLAQQHFETCKKRFKSFPVNVAKMSGMCSGAENEKVASDLKKGLVDIVVGTHRVLSKDVDFKDLGLLMIDEEQRFGVNHKEKIKKLKEDVDVLALSATPIPRTLNMSLAGIRDMSILEEPPQDRMPIQTFVLQQDDEIIKKAILREVQRGGQVYYIYNRVKKIEEAQMHLEELMPDVSFANVHGKMDKKSLDLVMSEFINGKTDVLVSTTIVETGLDIPNVNTIIIENAEKFGLSQLYQLRGRVGRSARTSYAFLMYQRDKVITEVAQKRLAAINEMTDLGSGYRLAMKDLEIRGAGNILGKVQHGHMYAVGFALYTQMLNEAVLRKKGEHIPKHFETSIDINVDMLLPDTYIAKEDQKLDLYKRIAGITSPSDKKDMEEELLDRFGQMPASVENCLQVALIKALAHNIGVTDIREMRRGDSRTTRIEFGTGEESMLCSDEIISSFCEQYGKDMICSFHNKRFILWKSSVIDLKTKEFLKELLQIMKKIGEKT